MEKPVLRIIFKWTLKLKRTSLINALTIAAVMECPGGCKLST
jgi:hypothetical protein